MGSDFVHMLLCVKVLVPTVTAGASELLRLLYHFCGRDVLFSDSLGSLGRDQVYDISSQRAYAYMSLRVRFPRCTSTSAAMLLDNGFARKL